MSACPAEPPAPRCWGILAARSCAPGIPGGSCSPGSSAAPASAAARPGEPVPVPSNQTVLWFYDHKAGLKTWWCSRAFRLQQMFAGREEVQKRRGPGWAVRGLLCAGCGCCPVAAGGAGTRAPVPKPKGPSWRCGVALLAGDCLLCLVFLSYI